MKIPMKQSSNTADLKPTPDDKLDLPNAAPRRRAVSLREIILASERCLPYENRRRGLSRGHFLTPFELKD